MYPPRTLARAMAKNIRKSGTPLGIPASRINTWWNGDNGDGNTMLFTGLMYQMMPYITKITRTMHRFEGKGVERIVSALSAFSSLFSTSSTFSTWFSRADGEVRYFNGILGKISELLEDSGVEFFYNPELDFYSGILFYEIGDDEGFSEHASLVAENLREQGIREVITVDPHTTYTLKILYPKFTGIGFDVKSYLEVLRCNEKGDVTRKSRDEIVFHDPCYYARHLEMADVLRNTMREFGVECIDIRNSRRLTSCCGGPIESISPRLSFEISRNRYKELKMTGCKVVTACPICLGNFKGWGEVKDLAEVLWERRTGDDQG